MPLLASLSCICIKCLLGHETWLNQPVVERDRLCLSYAVATVETPLVETPLHLQLFIF